MAKDNISWWLDAIENKELVLPEFQREFTWSKDQIKTLVDSMLKEYPTGALLFWKTKNVPALKNMPDFAPDHRVLILLDGQQRLTSLYMLMKDAIPPYYNAADITNDPRNLCYNLLTREFLYFTPQLMEGRPEWVLVKDCFCGNGRVSPMPIAQALALAECGDNQEPEPDTAKTIEFFQRVDANHKALLAIESIAVPVMYVEDGTSLKDALTVFDRVNSQGTPLTEADIALAHMCSNWPEIRRKFKEKRAELKQLGFDFGLTFYIRAMNAVINCRAEYSLLHGLKEADLQEGWAKLDKILDFLVNYILINGGWDNCYRRCIFLVCRITHCCPPFLQ
jgi:hypothetical protein